jgi:hypothetical protein
MHASKDLMWWVKEEIFWVGMGKWTHPLFFFFSFCTYGAHPTPFLCLSPRVRVTCYYSMKRWTHGCMHVQSRIRAEKIFFTTVYYNLLLYWIWSISGAIELSACRLGCGQRQRVRTTRVHAPTEETKPPGTRTGMHSTGSQPTNIGWSKVNSGRGRV